MHKRFPGVTNPKKIWAQCPWAKYVIKVEGVYIVFDDEEDAWPYIQNNMTDLHRKTPHGKGSSWNSRETYRG